MYPVFGGAGASFGYWLTGVTARQNAILAERRKSLLEKRKRRAEREARGVLEGGVEERAVGRGGTGGADMI